jgi:hypothetical protein
MKPETEQKMLSAGILLIAIATIFWVVIGQVKLQQMLDSAAQAGWAVDVSVDPMQRDIRLILALLFGSIAVWSQKGTRVALALFALSVLIAEVIGWAAASQHNPFDRTEAEIHIAVGVILLLAVLLWFRRAKPIIIAALAPLYMLLEYLFWYIHTLIMKRSAGVEELAPPACSIISSMVHTGGISSFWFQQH